MKVIDDNRMRSINKLGARHPRPATALSEAPAI